MAKKIREVWMRDKPAMKRSVTFAAETKEKWSDSRIDELRGSKDAYKTQLSSPASITLLSIIVVLALQHMKENGAHLHRIDENIIACCMHGLMLSV